MERYVVKQGDTLSAIASRAHVSLKTLIAANRKVKNPNRILVGQFINLPVEARHPVGSVGGPTLEDVLGKGVVPTDGEPSEDHRFVQNAIVAVGIPVWGGAFALYRKVENGRASDAIMLARSDVSLSLDPLKDSFAEIKVLYSTRAYANHAVSAFNSRVRLRITSATVECCFQRSFPIRQRRLCVMQCGKLLTRSAKTLKPLKS
jgi:LysM repeat protein